MVSRCAKQNARVEKFLSVYVTRSRQSGSENRCQVSIAKTFSLLHQAIYQQEVKQDNITSACSNSQAHRIGRKGHLSRPSTTNANPPKAAQDQQQHQIPKILAFYPPELTPFVKIMLGTQCQLPKSRHIKWPRRMMSTCQSQLTGTF